MNNTTALKLIAVIDSKQMMLYDAQGVKITNNKPLKLPLDLEEHHHHREKDRVYTKINLHLLHCSSLILL